MSRRSGPPNKPRQAATQPVAPARSAEPALEEPVGKVELDAAALRASAAGLVVSLTTVSGELVFPALPACAGAYTQQLLDTFAAAGRGFDESEARALRVAVDKWVAHGFERSPQASLRVTYRTDPDKPALLRWNVASVVPTSPAAQGDRANQGPLFDGPPDARLLKLARSLGARSHTTFLDVGALHGRNAIALARLGHPTDALEPVPEVAAVLRERAEVAGVVLSVVGGDFWDEGLSLPRARYRLVSVSEPWSRLRGMTPLRALFRRLGQVLEPSGVALVPMFVARPGYLPEPASREVAEARRSPVYTRDEVEAAAFGQSLELVSDDSALAYERAHGDPFPPAPWFEAWASGRHVFDLPAAAPPFELRWLVYRRV